MNTPAKARRFNSEAITLPSQPGSTYVLSLTKPSFARLLAQIVSEFVHLEIEMADVLAVVLGMSQRQPADYVMRAIIAPRGRISLMQELLEKSYINKELSAKYDKTISEFSSINTARNNYVHGQWYTEINNKHVCLAKLRKDEHGFGLLAAEVEPRGDLEALID